MFRTSLYILANLALTVLGAAQIPNEICIPSRHSGELQLFQPEGTVAVVEISPRRIEGIAPDALGHFWLTQRGEFSLVLKLAIDGTLLDQYPLAGQAYGIGAAVDTTIWVVTESPHRLVRLSQTGDTLLTVDLPGRPRALAIGNEGSIWVTLHESKGYTLRFDPEGTLLALVPVGKAPLSVAPSPNCCVWVANFRDCTMDCISEANTIGYHVSLHSYPRSLAVDRDFNVWVALQELDRIDKYDQTGQLLFSVPTEKFPTSVAFDGTGQLWVICELAGKVQRFDEDGQLLGTHDVSQGAHVLGAFAGFQRAVVQDPRGDSDGDGYDNYNEGVSGSNPMDSSDVPGTVEVFGAPDWLATLSLRFTDRHNPEHPYLAYLTGSIDPPWPFSLCWPCDPRALPFNVYDPLFLTTFASPALAGFVGVLDENGQGFASLALVEPGLTFYVGFVTFDLGLGHLGLRSLVDPVRIDVGNTAIHGRNGSQSDRGGRESR
jgi:sugar lactone lactonase YvrE